MHNNNELILNKKLLIFLIFAAIVANAVGLLSPILASNDAYSYAVLTKNMLISGDYISLTFGGLDWLDKPHLPFWLTAISFNIFGINPFAYILPGFIFHLIGAFYTYKLAQKLYGESVALLSALVYLTTLRLLLSSIDVRAEAFLLGSIIPACYYFWLFYKSEAARIKYMLLGAFFAGLALMGKGLFTMIVICSGLVVLWIYKKEYKNMLSIKWIIALLACFVFALPEFVSLYIQFDMHPEKVVFGSQNVSGISWFFWGSQFGRFFNTGPIVNTNGNIWFFMHTFLWAFLPWTLFLLFGAVADLKARSTISKSEKENLVFLLGSFLPTFILFSATKFQLDYYINILLPFCAILTAHYIVKHSLNVASWAQIAVSLLLIALALILSIKMLPPLWIAVVAILSFCAIFFFYLQRKQELKQKSILFAVSSTLIAIICVTLINSVVYTKYNAGYHMAKFLNQRPHLPVYGYKTYSFSLEMDYAGSHKRIMDIKELANVAKPYYILTDKDYLGEINQEYKIIGTFGNIIQNRFIISMLNEQKFKENNKTWLLLELR
jgi:4-amino-4-deoxy-L-arabinose transferase-like glycosyltransferase